MQIGYNNDVQYRGKTFHIQTEDRGNDAAEIESQIFHAGAILDTSIVSYQKVLDEEDDVDSQIARVRAMMGANHKSLYRKLTKGEYDDYAGLDPLGADADVETPDPDEFAPSQDRVPAQALQIEQGIEPDELSGIGGEHVDLSQLQNALKEDAAAAEAVASGQADGPSSDVEEVAPTMVASPETLQKAVGRDLRSRPTSGTFRLPTYADTGIRAFRGLDATRDDLAVVELVEQFMAG